MVTSAQLHILMVTAGITCLLAVTSAQLHILMVTARITFISGYISSYTLMVTARITFIGGYISTVTHTDGYCTYHVYWRLHQHSYTY